MDSTKIDRINTLHHKAQSVGLTEEEKKENSKISGTCHCDCAVFRYPACHCSWITEEANTGMERKTTGRMETKTGKSAGR